MRVVNTIEHAASWGRKAVGSTWFLWAVVALFAAVSTWIALTGVEGFLYDEEYHFDIVQVYTHQWTPFIHQGDAYGQLGDISRYGSYLYHYLVSFPVRGVAVLGGDLRAQLITARLFSVVFLSGSLPFYWLLVRELGASRAIAGASIALFTSVPIMPALAATVNYDTLMMLLTSVFLVMAVRLYKLIYNSGSVHLPEVFALLALGCFASLTKEASLPIFAGALIALTIEFIISRHRHGITVDWKGRGAGFWLSGVLALIGIGLFIERYLVNLLLYHSPQPDCSKVHSTSMCMEYSLWARNYTLKLSGPHIAFTIGSLVSYFVQKWIPTNFWSLQFLGTSTRPTLGSPSTALLLKLGAALAFAFILVTLVWIAKRPGITVVASAALLYVVSLLLVNIRDYYTTGQPIGVQGRYLLPFAPIVIALAGMSVARIFDRLYTRSVVPKALALLIVFLCVTQGGGALTYFVFAGDDWYAVAGWPLRVNHVLGWVANKLLLG